MLRAATVHHGLPSPSGDTYYSAWLAGSGIVPRWAQEPRDLAEWLSRDPLMPSLLFGFLASGHCGIESELPDACATLVAHRSVTREALLDHVLRLLTAPQRPASQRVLVKIATRLEVRVDEIPGGLGL